MEWPASCARNWIFASTLTTAVAALPEAIVRNVGVREAGIRAAFDAVEERSRNQSFVARVPVPPSCTTTTGTRRLVNVPSPAPPELLYPQQRTSPATMSAHVCRSPAAIAATPDDNPETG